jgi:hypothetical protein
MISLLVMRMIVSLFSGHFLCVRSRGKACSFFFLPRSVGRTWKLLGQTCGEKRPGQSESASVWLPGRENEGPRNAKFPSARRFRILSPEKKTGAVVNQRSNSVPNKLEPGNWIFSPVEHPHWTTVPETERLPH